MRLWTGTRLSRWRSFEIARLDGKVALITGVGTGIGRATARAMAAEGAKVVVAEIIAEAGEQTAQIVAQAGGDCIAIATDVTQEDSVSAAVDAAVRHYGGLHILHNNAGGSIPVDSTVVEVPIEEFWRAIRLDLFGTFSAAASAYRRSSSRAADR
jgi:NAD(P)-dependent dehydrogenase (short-subunit alcohol dehydrogenase family)